MKLRLIADLIKKWGISLVLREIINVLSKFSDEKVLELSSDIQDALDKFERSTKTQRIKR